MKKIIAAAIFVVCLFPVLSEAQLNLPCRPSLAVQGVLQPGITLDILSANFDDSIGSLEVILNNWGTTATGEIGLKYSESSQFMPGSRITLYMDCGALHFKKAEGKIVVLAPKFPESGPPIVGLTVQVEPTIAKPVQLNLSYGRDLLSFYPILKPGTIDCTGLTKDLPDLRKGALIRIGQVGRRFEGDYIVTGTVHSWDLTRGSQIKFKGKKVTENPVSRK